MMINGMPHGPERGDDRLPAPHAEASRDGEHIYVEPWRAKAFPVVKDLVADRSRVRPHHPGRRVRVA